MSLMSFNTNRPALIQKSARGRICLTRKYSTITHKKGLGTIAQVLVTCLLEAFPLWLGYDDLSY